MIRQGALYLVVFGELQPRDLVGVNLAVTVWIVTSRGKLSNCVNRGVIG